jgi:hypothetical protein
VGERVGKGWDNKQLAPLISQNKPNKWALHASCLQLLEVARIQNKKENIRLEPDKWNETLYG